ncbi:MAG: Lrp/AsnC ligand binding domain-containing protein [Nitrososphaerota archaeon]
MKLNIVQTNLDKIDTLIINSLMLDGRKSFRQIAREIGVSTPTVESHFSRMMGVGIIKNIVPILDSERLEKQTSAFVYLKIAHPSQTLVIANKISSIPEIKNVYLLTGEYNLMVKVITEKPEQVEELVRTRIAIIKEVLSSTIQIVTRTIKESQSVTIKEGIPITIKCDYCNNDIMKNSKTLQVGRYTRNFCCSSCLTLYKQKYKGRIDALSK